MARVFGGEDYLFVTCSKDVLIQLDCDARSRYQSKLSCDEGTDQLPDPYYSINDWTDDLNDWPDLSFGDIYIYLIDRNSSTC